MNARRYEEKRIFAFNQSLLFEKWSGCIILAFLVFSMIHLEACYFDHAVSRLYSDWLINIQQIIWELYSTRGLLWRIYIICLKAIDNILLPLNRFSKSKMFITTRVFVYIRWIIKQKINFFYCCCFLNSKLRLIAYDNKYIVKVGDGVMYDCWCQISVPMSCRVCCFSVLRT